MLFSSSTGSRSSPSEKPNRELARVSHRLSAIWRADRICFMDEGRIVETGSHEELTAVRNGAHRKFLAMSVGAAA